ncbi:hypothetical protein TrLO_g9733 [Triparma laevis f. longispina]|nr:hypothetical protein TrLO_g9733 [Triparma laevis f. longispina]
MGSQNFIGPKWLNPRDAWGQWSYIDLGCGINNSSSAMTVTWDGNFIIWNNLHGEYVFDISMWKIEEGNHLVLVKGIGEKVHNTKNEGDNKGRKFTINTDGTISPQSNNNLCLGAAMPVSGAVDFSMSGWTGYNSRFNGLYKVSDKKSDEGFPVYTHMPTEGMGAGSDWCRLWYHKGCWRIGHMHWTDNDKERCCAFTSSGPIIASNLTGQIWLDFGREGCNQDHGIPGTGFVEKGHGREIRCACEVVEAECLLASMTATAPGRDKVEVKKCAKCCLTFPKTVNFCAECGNEVESEWVVVEMEEVKMAVASMI